MASFLVVLLRSDTAHREGRNGSTSIRGGDKNRTRLHRAIAITLCHGDACLPGRSSRQATGCTDDARRTGDYRPTKSSYHAGEPHGEREQNSSNGGARTAYNCFSSGHKFCREVCPVTQVPKRESHPDRIHGQHHRDDQGLLNIEDVADDYVHCVQCGGCEIRCPNTLFVGDPTRPAPRREGGPRGAGPAGRQRTRPRRLEAVEPANAGADQRAGARYHEKVAAGPGLRARLGRRPGYPDRRRDHHVRRLRGGVLPDLQDRATAQVLQKAGVEFGLMNEQWCCGGPAAEMGYVEQSRTFAEHNVDDWRASGVKRIIAIEPHDYIHFTEDYPAYFGADFDFEVVQIMELVAELIRDGNRLERPINKTVTYHDPCRLNKRKNIHEAPRFILNSIPGLTFKDVDHVTQWSYCSGGGGGLPIEKPEITARSAEAPGPRRGTRGGHARQRLRVVGAATGHRRPQRRHRGGRHHRVGRRVGRHRDRRQARRIRIGAR